MTMLDILHRCPLFQGSGDQDILSMLSCLSATRRSYPVKSIIYAAGRELFEFGVVLSGSIDIVQTDFWGNENMVARLFPGQVFAESFALAQSQKLPVSVVANQHSEVLTLNGQSILKTCDSACPHHERLIANLLLILAQKNVYLTEKLEIVTHRTIREKLLAYLSLEAKKAGDTSFTIPYNRQALADYLAVDRSALSRILSDMQKEGLISFSKNHFSLNDAKAARQ